MEREYLQSKRRRRSRPSKTSKTYKNTNKQQVNRIKRQTNLQGYTGPVVNFTLKVYQKGNYSKINEPTHTILELIAYAQNPPVNAYADLFIGIQRSQKSYNLLLLSFSAVKTCGKRPLK